MAVTFGVLDTFNHLQQDWQTYRSRILQFFIANDINESSDKAGVRRKAILLSALTESSYKLAKDLALPNDVADLNYEIVLKIFDDHFTPKRCGFAERHRFYTAMQNQGEGHYEWAARIRGLAAHCGFINLEEALLDRFVMGMVAGYERDKLFSKDLQELTLSKAVELAESVRCARDGAAAAHMGAVPAARANIVQDVGVFSISGKTADKCSVCGYTNHKTSQCKFKNYKCKRCGQKGHLRRMCVNSKIKHVEEGEVGEGEDGESFCNIRCSRDRPMTESINVGGVNFEFEVDSGSPINAISHTTYMSFFNHLPLSPTRKSFKSYTGEKMHIYGCINVPVSYRGNTRALEIYVVRHGGPPLLGRSFLCAFNLEIAPATSNMYYCNATDEPLIAEFISDFPQLFSGDLGCFNKYDVKLYLKPDSNPIFFKARPVAFALKDKVDKELDRLVSLGVLKPVEHSEYASPIVPVLKNDGNVRLCADYSVTINKQLVVEKYPLPTIDEMFAKLHGGKYYSKVDLSMAYNQLCLSEDSQAVTCINTHRGLFNFTRLVFGLSSAAAIFQRAMESILTGMEGVLVFQNDVLCSGKTKAENLERLRGVLKRLQDAGLTVQRNKCEFLKREVRYLGHVIDQHGIRKSKDKVAAIVDAPIPTNVSQLQSFLGLINYYRNFIPDASAILSPLYNLLHKNTKWAWTSAHTDAFIGIKNILASDKVLTHFDPHAQLILTVDASNYALGSILSQICSDGLERPISYASRTLTTAERRYSQIQKEATAIIFGVRRYHQYLYGRSNPFVLRTDHKPLITIFGPHKGIPEVSANRLQRYAIFLGAYNYTIEYIKSADNSADYFSRATLPPRDSAPAPAALESAAYVNFVVDGTLPVTLKQLQDESERDEVFQIITNWVQNGWPRKVTDSRTKPYFDCRLQLSYENGCLMRGHKVVIPSRLRAKVCTELHSSHFGIVKIKAAARARFWFPGIDAYLLQLISTCAVCAQLRPSPPRAPLAPWPFPPHPFYRIHIDFLGPIHNKMYLIVVDAFSKWVECYCMNTSYGSKAVIERLYDLMSRVGVPHVIVSDNGTSFSSKEFKDFCQCNGINHVLSCAYNAASNGQAESMVKVVKNGIKSIVLDSKNISNETIQKFLFDYRNSKNSTTDKSPAELLYGRPLRNRLDLLSPASAVASSPDLSHVVSSKQCSQAKYYRGTTRPDFKVNDLVWAKKVYNNNKFIWIKGIVKKILGRVVYLVHIPESDVVVKKHKNQLWSRIENQNSPTLDQTPNWCPESIDTDSETLEDDASISPASAVITLTTDRDGSRSASASPRAASAARAAAAQPQEEGEASLAERHVPAASPPRTPASRGTPEPPAADASPIFRTPTASQTPTQEPTMREKRTRPKVDYKKLF